MKNAKCKIISPKMPEKAQPKGSRGQGVKVSRCQGVNEFSLEPLNPLNLETFKSTLCTLYLCGKI